MADIVETGTCRRAQCLSWVNFKYALSAFAATTCWMVISSPAMAQDAQANLITMQSGQQSMEVELNGPVSFMGVDFLADDLSGFFGVASDSAYLLVISGRVEAEGHSAKVGDALIIPPYKQGVSKLKFDAGRLQSSLINDRFPLTETISANLEGLVKRQQRQIFFGLYTPTRLNLAAPNSASAELARRSLVGGEVVQSIRFSTSGTAEAVESSVVSAFQTALAQGDAPTVATLLDPSAFGIGDLRSGGAAARRVLANRLVASQDWSLLLEQGDFEKADQQAVWRLQTNTEAFALALKTVGDFTYISYLKKEA